tara:strand:- start:104 stop:529 length:426 start_codon:yes stop_codon:yes gene_type:complete
MLALWKCLRSHDEKYGQKFTSSLYRFVRWECIRELVIHNRKPAFIQENHQYFYDDAERFCAYGREPECVEDKNIKDDEIMEFVELLSPGQREIIYLRFYENCTFAEIGQKQGYTKQAARQNVNKSISRLRELCKHKDAFGV